MANLLDVSVGIGNEIVINAGRLSKGTDKVYLCNCCGDIVGGVEQFDDMNWACNLCTELVIPKCTDCAYLVAGEGDTYNCDKFSKPCIDVAENCEL